MQTRLSASAPDYRGAATQPRALVQAVSAADYADLRARNGGRRGGVCSDAVASTHATNARRADGHCSDTRFTRWSGNPLKPRPAPNCRIAPNRAQCAPTQHARGTSPRTPIACIRRQRRCLDAAIGGATRGAFRRATQNAVAAPKQPRHRIEQRYRAGDGVLPVGACGKRDRLPSAPDPRRPAGAYRRGDAEPSTDPSHA
jgi:hypothetical protein